MDDDLDGEAALRARAQSRVGALLARKYRLDGVLGFGGMATVYAATHRNGKEVALKLLHPELALNAEVWRRFLREGYVANHVKHPGAVSVLDDDVTEEGWAFLVMERLEGITLEALWEARVQVNPACVVAIVLEVLDVMSAAHEKGIVHRDLKPANLFLTHSGEVKVLDFGIARMREATPQKDTTQGGVMGTPTFMAPEQAMGQSKDIDAQTDLWAVGAIAFSLLVGEVVHPAENSRQSMVYAATRAARSLSVMAPTLHEALAKVFDRALAFDKASRWTSATAMREALVAAAMDAYGELPGREVICAAVGGCASLRPSRHGNAPTGNGALAPAAHDQTKELGVNPSLAARPAPMPTPTRSATMIGLADATSPRVLRPAMTTSRPVATASPALANHVRSGGRGRFAAAAASVSVLALAAGMLLRAPTAASAGAEPVTDVVETHESVAGAFALGRAAEPLPALPVPSASTSSQPVAPARVRVVAPLATASATPRIAPVGVASSSRAAAPCTPPFVIDRRTGVKKWKVECL